MADARTVHTSNGRTDQGESGSAYHAERAAARWFYAPDGRGPAPGLPRARRPVPSTSPPPDRLRVRERRSRGREAFGTDDPGRDPVEVTGIHPPYDRLRARTLVMTPSRWVDLQSDRTAWVLSGIVDLSLGLVFF